MALLVTVIGIAIVTRTNLLVTFSTKVFSGNLKRQTARSHLTKRYSHVRSSQGGVFNAEKKVFTQMIYLNVLIFTLNLFFSPVPHPQ